MFSSSRWMFLSILGIQKLLFDFILSFFSTQLYPCQNSPSTNITVVSLSVHHYYRYYTCFLLRCISEEQLKLVPTTLVVDFLPIPVTELTGKNTAPIGASQRRWLLSYVCSFNYKSRAVPQPACLRPFPTNASVQSIIHI